MYARERAGVVAEVRRRVVRAVPELRAREASLVRRSATLVLLGLTLTLVAAVSR
jgi:hypothetical protein